MTAASAVEQVANAVLYEGFLLYPYRLSSVKNRHRWNFGVLYPEPFGGAQGDRAMCQAQCLVEAPSGAEVDGRIRFLELAAETAVERSVEAPPLSLGSPPQRPPEVAFATAAAPGSLHLHAEAVGPNLFRVTVRVANHGRFEGEDRDQALARAFISTHAILTVRGGRFVSLVDPPAQYVEAAAACCNLGLWPVLAGPDDTQMLCAPIILPDHPRTAPQSPGDLFDATEIDEILTLRIQTLSDDEKGQMRAADGRSRAILERSEAMTREELGRLHAAMRPDGPRTFQKGDRVTLRPKRRADIFDLALAGKRATVLSVEQDFENGLHACVTVDDDPGRDLGLEAKPGHRFFFGMDELEPA
jgi:hypothetical protein